MNSNYRLIDEIQQPAFWLTPMSVTLKHVPCGRVSIPEVLDLFCREIIIYICIYLKFKPSYWIYFHTGKYNVSIHI